jgi:hypothetical protein
MKMKKTIGYTLIALFTLLFISCNNVPSEGRSSSVEDSLPVIRKYVCKVRGDDTTVEYRAYLLTTGEVGNDPMLATADDAIQITVFERNEEKILKTYKGVKYTMMTLNPGVFLIVHVHDGRMETIDTIDTIRLK